MDAVEAVRAVAEGSIARPGWSSASAASAVCAKSLVRSMVLLGEPIGSGCVAALLTWSLAHAASKEPDATVETLLALCTECFKASPGQARATTTSDAIVDAVQAATKAGLRRARAAAYDLAVASSYSEPAKKLSIKGKVFAPSIDAYYDVLVAAELCDSDDLAPFASTNDDNWEDRNGLGFIAAWVRRLGCIQSADDEIGPLWACDATVAAARADVEQATIVRARRTWLNKLCRCAASLSEDGAVDIVPDLAVLTKRILLAPQLAGEKAAVESAWQSVVSLCARCLAAASNKHDLAFKAARGLEACIGLASPVTLANRQLLNGLGRLNQLDAYHNVLAAVSPRLSPMPIATYLFHNAADVTAVDAAARALVALLIGESFWTTTSIFNAEGIVTTDDAWITPTSTDNGPTRDSTPRLDDSRLDVVERVRSNHSGCVWEAAFASAAIALALAPVVARSGARRLAGAVASSLERATRSLANDEPCSRNDARLGYLATRVASTKLEAKGLVRICREIGDAACVRAAQVARASTARSIKKVRNAASLSGDDDDRPMMTARRKPEKDILSSSSEHDSDDETPSFFKKRNTTSLDSSDDEEVVAEVAALDSEARATRLWLCRLAIEADASLLDEKLVKIFCEDVRDRADAAAVAACCVATGRKNHLTAGLAVLEAAWRQDAAMNGKKRRRDRRCARACELTDEDGARLHGAAARSIEVAGAIFVQKSDDRSLALVVGYGALATEDDGIVRATRTRVLAECARAAGFPKKLTERAVTRARDDLRHEHAACCLAAAHAVGILAAATWTRWTVDEFLPPVGFSSRLVEEAALKCIGGLAATQDPAALSALFKRVAQRQASSRAAAYLARAARTAGFSSAAALLDANLAALVVGWCCASNRYDISLLLTFPSWVCGLETNYSPPSSFAHRLRDVASPLIAAGLLGDQADDEETCQKLAAWVARRAPKVIAAVYVARELEKDESKKLAFDAALQFVDRQVGIHLRRTLSRSLPIVVEAALDDATPLATLSHHGVESWARAARRALDRFAVECLGDGDAASLVSRCNSTLVALRLSDRIKNSEPPRLQRALAALDLIVELARGDAGALCAATAALVCVVESAATTSTGRRFAVASMAKLIDDNALTPPLAATIHIVANSVLAAQEKGRKLAQKPMQVPAIEADDDLHAAATKLRVKIEKSCHSGAITNDAKMLRDSLLFPRSVTATRRRRDKLDGAPAAVPDLDFGNGPLERPRRVHALLNLRSSAKRIAVPALESTRLVNLASSTTVDPSERALAGDCIGTLLVASSRAVDVVERHDHKLHRPVQDGVAERKAVLARELARCLVSASRSEASAALVSALEIAANNRSREAFAEASCGIDRGYSNPHAVLVAALAKEPTSKFAAPGVIANDWVCRIASDLVETHFDQENGDPFLGRCAAICGASRAFARLALPALVYDIVAARPTETDASHRAERRADVSNKLREGLETEAKVVIEVVDFARARELELFLFGSSVHYEQSPPAKTYLPYSPPLELDANALAEAALKAKCPASAALYAELSLSEGKQPESTQRVLVEAYAALGDADTLRALSASQAEADPAARLALYRAEGSWSSVLGLADAALSSFGASCGLQPAVARALQSLGLSHIADAYARSAAHDDAALNCLAEVRHETAWRGSHLDLTSSIASEFEVLTSSGFNGALRDALARIGSRDCDGAMRALDLARDAALGNNFSMTRLAAVADTRDAVEALRSDLADTCENTLLVCASKTVPLTELALAAREGWLRAARRAVHDESARARLGKALRETIAASAEVTTRSGQVDAAEAAAARLSLELPDDQQDAQGWRRWLQLADAKSLWARGRCEEATKRIARLASHDDDHGLEALRLAGAWAVEARSLPASAVLDLYLRPAAACRPASESRFALGDYVARLHSDAVKRLSSAEWHQSERVASERRRELERCEARLQHFDKQQRDPVKDALEIHGRVLKRECRADQAARTAHLEACAAYLVEALRAFRAVVEIADFDLASRSAASLVALWFFHAGPECEDIEARTEIANVAETSKVAPFAPLLYQLSSRLGQGDKALDKLVLRLCREAVPDHAVLQLVALANGDKVEGGLGAEHFLKNQAKHSQGLSRLATARAFLNSLRDQNLVQGLEHLGSAYVELGMIDAVGMANGTKVSFRSLVTRQRTLAFFSTRLDTNGSYAGRAIQNDDRSAPRISTQLPSARDAARNSWMRDNAPRIWKYVPEFRITETGAHRPKIITLYGDDGQMYREVVKGHDDTRQDAVMQQVFDAVNDFVCRDTAAARPTSKRPLRTYNVVPFAPLTGAIEFVERTISFSDYLVSKPRDVNHLWKLSSNQRKQTGLLACGAHHRYFPNDLKHAECTELYKTALLAARSSTSSQSSSSSKRKRDATRGLRDAFLDICGKFRPAFRYFFVEFFGDDAQTWLDRTRAYATSVAAASMVGYVLGIGDRHAQNILVKTDTAEVVHIDFGYAFEQGKALSIPETVPFRLTRDVVDGMGLQKTDGPYQTCAVAIVKALRAHTQPLMTILDVLVHDPLYNWMLSPHDARHNKHVDTRLRLDVTAPVTSSSHMSASSDSAGQTPAAAERVLLRVRHKLQGYADDGSQVLSPEGQVNQLIADAQDPDNLCRLYWGWAPWL